MDDINTYKEDLVQIARLALSGQTDDIRLFVARLVRKYRHVDPDIANQLDLFLKNNPVKTRGPLRKNSGFEKTQQNLPIDEESHLSLLRAFDENPDTDLPLMPPSLKTSFSQLIKERSQTKHLLSLGLQPTSSAIFVGPPGVGKTLTAKWLAGKLNVPFYTLDLTAVMSSLLGQSGNNLRIALDFAKRTPCILLLDEIDAIAKRRGDEADVGELKRLVTVILQEVDDWPSTSLLLAATNHPELIDPALWRRFDDIINFDLPDAYAIKLAVKRFFGPDYSVFRLWINALTLVFQGQSYSDIERTIQRFRRALALGMSTDAELVGAFVKSRAESLDHKAKIKLAALLAKQPQMSQHTVSKLTGVSRDTIRKHTADKMQKLVKTPA